MRLSLGSSHAPDLTLAIARASGVGSSGEFNPQSLFTGGAPGYLYDNNDFRDPSLWRTNWLLNSVLAGGGAIPTNWTVGGGTGVSAPTASTVFPGETAYAQSATAERPFIAQSVTVDVGAQYTASVYIEAVSGLLFSALLGTNTVSPTSTKLNGVAVNPLDPATVGLLEMTFTVTSTPTSFRFGIGISAPATGTLRFSRPQVQKGVAFTTYQPITDFNSEFLAAFPNTSMFATADGSAPALLNGPVGLQGDKSRGLMLGAELWNNASVSFGGEASQVSPGVYRIYSSAGVNSSVVGLPTNPVAGTWYQVTFTVDSIAVLGAGVRVCDTGTVFTTVGTHTSMWLADGAADVFIKRNSTACDIQISNVSVKSLPGNHRYQTTSASRPTLRGTPTGANLVTNGDFSGGTTGWNVGLNATLSVVAGALRVTSIANGITSANTAVPTVIGRTYRLRLTFVTDNSTGNSFVYVGSTAGASDVSNNNVASVLGGKEFYFTATSTTSYVTVTSASGALAGDYSDWDAVSVHDVSSGSVAAPYALQFDGVDDFLQTSSIDFTSTDAVTVCNGVRKLSDAAAACAMELGTNVNSVNGSFGLFGPANANPNFSFISRGTATSQALYQNASVGAPKTCVLTGIGDISVDSAILRVDGIQQATSATDQGTGNYGNFPVYFGRRSGTSLPLNGLMFSGWCVGKTVNASELTSGEAWVTTRTGVLG